MNDDEVSERTGRCLCGAVRYVATAPLAGILHCHCENCRRLTGNFVAASRCDTDQLVIENDADRLEWLDLDYARYGFCRGCGSTLFYRAADRPELTAIMIGTLDEASDLVLEGVWYGAEAHPHLTLPDHVTVHPGDGTQP